MIKEIVVLSREQAELLVNEGPPFTPNGKWAIISVYGSTDTPLLNISQEKWMSSLEHFGMVGYLPLQFDDVESQREIEIFLNLKEKGIIFNEKHADKVIKFVDEMNEKVETLIVHCFAGISRSGAIGAWSALRVGVNNRQFWDQNPQIHPNTLVFNLLMKRAKMGYYADEKAEPKY